MSHTPNRNSRGTPTSNGKAPTNNRISFVVSSDTVLGEGNTSRAAPNGRGAPACSFFRGRSNPSMKSKNNTGRQNTVPPAERDSSTRATDSAPPSVRSSSPSTATDITASNFIEFDSDDEDGEFPHHFNNNNNRSRTTTNHFNSNNNTRRTTTNTYYGTPGAGNSYGSYNVGGGIYTHTSGTPGTSYSYSSSGTPGAGNSYGSGNSGRGNYTYTSGTPDAGISYSAGNNGLNFSANGVTINSSGDVFSGNTVVVGGNGVSTQHNNRRRF